MMPLLLFKAEQGTESNNILPILILFSKFSKNSMIDAHVLSLRVNSVALSVHRQKHQLSLASVTSSQIFLLKNILLFNSMHTLAIDLQWKGKQKYV